MKATEILAPVGNIDMLYAGLAAGADAFYLALDDFGARAYAKNFSLDNIEGVIDYVHLFGKKVYITMNTLIKDEEMDKALSYVESLYKFGVDGLLIQDIGFFNIIKDQVKGLDLHASTQMAVRDYHGARALMDLGFKRLVIARETPISEIRKIAKLPIEKEVFVHGSLCVSYSGECLMSSHFGERSANRGRCAGVCRKKYKLEKDGKILGEDYYLNMKDLNVLDQIDSLTELGIDSIKIEGRMKSPSYVYTAVKSYKDRLETGSYDRAKLRDISNRGYTEGFIFDQRSDYILKEADIKHRPVGVVELIGNKKAFRVKTDLYKKDNLEVMTEAGKKLPLTLTEDIRKGEVFFLDKYKDSKLGSFILMLNSEIIKDDLEEGLKTYRDLPVDIVFEAMIGNRPRISLTYKGISVEILGENPVEHAKKVSLDEEGIRDNLDRFKDEVFGPRSIDIFIEDGIFLRKKDINKLRRDAIAALSDKISGAYKRSPIKIKKPELKGLAPKNPELNIELMTSSIRRELIEDFDKVYIKSFDEKYRGLDLYLDLDSHVDYDISDLLAYLEEKSIKGVIFNNYKDLDFIEDFKKKGIKIRIGRYLNVLNSYAFDFYSDFAESIESSVENDLESINKLSDLYNIEALSFGRVELMNMVHCPFSVIKKCGLKGCKTCRFKEGTIISEEGDRMLIKRSGGISKIYPEEPLGFDEDLFSENLSRLVSVFSEDDLRRYKNKDFEDFFNYKRGVI